MQPEKLETLYVAEPGVNGILTVTWEKCGGGRRLYCFELKYGKRQSTRLPGGEAHVESTPASNGRIYAINDVLIPPARPGSIAEIAAAVPDLSTLVIALRAGGLVGTLNGTGPFTVFAPSNEAFAALPAGTLQTLLLPQNKAQLVDILTYHVVAGTY